MIMLFGIGLHIIPHHCNGKTANFDQTLMLQENRLRGQISVDCVQIVHVVQRRQELIAPAWPALTNQAISSLLSLEKRDDSHRTCRL